MSEGVPVEREEMEVDVCIVGGGAAGLAAAIRIQQLVKEHNEAIDNGKAEGEKLDPMVVVLEKASEIGAHSLSGAVMNPVAVRELFADYKQLGCPIEAEVSDEAVYFLGNNSQFRFPVVPPPFRNHGNVVVSLSKFNRWLGSKAEELGVNIFPGFAAVEAIYNGDRLVGIRTGDKGLDKSGKPKANFEPGMILKAKLTIFAEGPRGSLFKQVAKKFDLWASKNKEVFEEGVKEIIQLPEGRVKPGSVIHTMGFPANKGLGGTFIYGLPNDQLVVGYVGYMNTPDPLMDPHRDLQRLKTHPFMRKMLEGGKVVAYGGKVIPGGGWYSMPKIHHNGFMVCGDTAGMVDIQKLKGIHLGMKSGILAAETALEALLAHDFSDDKLEAYTERVENSYIKKELYRVRNFHATVSRGLFASMPLLALQEITGGRGLIDNEAMLPDFEETEPTVEVWGAGGLQHEDNQLPTPDGNLFFDKLSSVYLTGTMHDEDSPNHLLVADTDLCRSECEPKYSSPCNHFCPAKVYEMVGDTERNLQINFTNCIHCKSCDIKCPYDNITWTPPEGGGGPRYTET